MNRNYILVLMWRRREEMSLDKNNLFPTIRSHKLTLIIETETSKIMKEKRVVRSLMALLKTGLWEELWRTHVFWYVNTHIYEHAIHVCVCVEKHYILFWHQYSCTGKDLKYLRKGRFAAMVHIVISRAIKNSLNMWKCSYLQIDQEFLNFPDIEEKPLVPI